MLQSLDILGIRQALVCMSQHCKVSNKLSAIIMRLLFHLLKSRTGGTKSVKSCTRVVSVPLFILDEVNDELKRIKRLPEAVQACNTSIL